MSVRKKKGKVVASKSNAAAPAAPAKPHVEPVSEQLVAERAYRIWQASGCAHGHDCDHWFQAERELAAS